jgi:chromosome segregation ATPase
MNFNELVTALGKIGRNRRELFDSTARDIAAGEHVDTETAAEVLDATDKTPQELTAAVALAGARNTVRKRLAESPGKIAAAKARQAELQIQFNKATDEYLRLQREICEISHAHELMQSKMDNDRAFLKQSCPNVDLLNEAAAAEAEFHKLNLQHSVAIDDVKKFSGYMKYLGQLVIMAREDVPSFATHAIKFSLGPNRAQIDVGELMGAYYADAISRRDKLAAELTPKPGARNVLAEVMAA